MPARGHPSTRLYLLLVVLFPYLQPSTLSFLPLLLKSFIAPGALRYSTALTVSLSWYEVSGK